MTSKATSDSTPTPEEAVKASVANNPGATIEGVAQQAGIARSTAGKMLGRLADAGKVVRHDGGRDGRTRLPDRFTLRGVKLPAAYAPHVLGKGSGKKAVKPSGTRANGNAAAGAPRKRKGSASASNKPERLKAGELEPLVLNYLEKNADAAPHSPSSVAKALGRSSGAVANCLERLTKAKKTKRVGKRPLRYDLAA